MRVTFVLPDATMAGGVRVVAIYAERLKRRGHTVTVVSTPPRPLGARQWARTLVRQRRWPSPVTRGPSHLDDVDVEHHVIDRHRPVTDADVPDADVVVATWWETAERVWRLGRSKGTKVYFLQHHETWGGPPDRVNATWRLPMHKVVISKWLMDIAVQQFGDRTASLVPNSVDLDQFRAAPRGKQPVPTVGTMYSTIHWKGTDICLRAVEIARRDVPELCLVAFGHTPPSADLPLPAGTEYVAHPPQDRIRETYGRCDAWLYGSRSEGFGLPILEAMACRTPVIGTPAGAAPELIGPGGGTLVGYDDPNAMAQAIVKTCRLPDPQWRQVSDTAYATATSYTWDQAADRFESALETAISASGRGGENISPPPVPACAVK